MSRGKLKEFGIELPALPAAGPGLLPSLSGSDLGEVLDEQACREATASWVKFQTELNLDVISDGGQYRIDEAGYLARGMGGFRPGGLVRLYGNRFWKRPVIAGKVRRKGPFSANWWKFAQGQTDKPVKGSLPGPYSLAVLALDSHYLDRRKAALAISREIRREAEALVKAGCRIIEIDEPALGVCPQELPLIIEAVQVMVSRLPAYFVLHACSADLARVYPGMLDLPVQNIYLEMAAGEMEFLDLMAAPPSGKDITVGILDGRAPRAEAPDAVRARLQKSLGALKPGQVWVAAGCGMEDLSEEEARARLKVMAEATLAARAALAARQEA